RAGGRAARSRCRRIPRPWRRRYRRGAMDPVTATTATRAAVPGRPWGRLVGLGAVAALTAYVGLVDPAEGGLYPVCPTRTLLGLDCPACRSEERRVGTARRCHVPAYSLRRSRQST